MEAIYKRRSIRKYKSDKISDNIVKEIIKAGMNAPSAGDEQPWQFIVINDREILNSIPSVHPYSKMILEAPAAILVCGDLSREKHKGFWIQDCSAAVENMLIAIAHLGLGSVWLGVYPREDRVLGLQDLLGIPESTIPFALLPIGIPAEKKPEKNVYHKDRIHLNRWGGAY